MDMKELGKPLSELPFMEELADLKVLENTKDVFLTNIMALLAEIKNILFIILSSPTNTLKFILEHNVKVDGIML